MARIVIDFEIPVDDSQPDWAASWRRSVSAGVYDAVLELMQAQRRHLGNGIKARVYTDDMPEGAVPTMLEVLEVVEAYGDEKSNDPPLHVLTDRGYAVATARWHLDWLCQTSHISYTGGDGYELTDSGRRHLRHERGDYSWLFRTRQEREEEISGDDNA
jgi:hypothetical protein